MVIASNLRPDQAEALRALLASAGIAAVAWDDAPSNLDAGLGSPLANVAVPATEEPRAREIARSAAESAAPPARSRSKRLVRAGPPSLPRSVLALVVLLVLVAVVFRCVAGP